MCRGLPQTARHGSAGARSERAAAAGLASFRVAYRCMCHFTCPVIPHARGEGKKGGLVGHATLQEGNRAHQQLLRDRRLPSSGRAIAAQRADAAEAGQLLPPTFVWQGTHRLHGRRGDRRCAALWHSRGRGCDRLNRFSCGGLQHGGDGAVRVLHCHCLDAARARAGFAVNRSVSECAAAARATTARAIMGRSAQGPPAAALGAPSPSADVAGVRPVLVQMGAGMRPVLGQMWAGVGPVLGQMWEGRAQS